MLQLGDTVEAIVEKVEPYGVYLKSGIDSILVLAPDLTGNRVDVEVFAKPGQKMKVKLLLLNAKTGIYRGSAKDVVALNPPHRRR